MSTILTVCSNTTIYTTSTCTWSFRKSSYMLWGLGVVHLKLISGSSPMRSNSCWLSIGGVHVCVCVCVCVCMCVVLRDFFGGRTLKRAIKLDSYTPILRLTNSQIWPATLFQQELYRTHTPHVVCMVLYPGYAMAISNVCNACGQTMMSHYTHITGSVNNIRRPHIVVEYCE